MLTTRVIAAPRERGFDAWVDPKVLSRWWGPKRFTSTFHEHDPRPGGHWRFVLHGPDGRDFKNHSTYVEVSRPSRIVLDHVSGPVYRATFDLEALGERTHVRWHMRFENAEFLTLHGDLVVNGNVENLDRLEAVLGPALTP